MLSTLHALLAKCFQLPYSASDELVSSQFKVFTYFWCEYHAISSELPFKQIHTLYNLCSGCAHTQVTLQKVHKKFFSSPAANTHVSPRSRAFLNTFKTAFERDFVSSTDANSLWRHDGQARPSNPSSSVLAGHVIARLKKWKHLLYCRVR